jgi:hypothetical protein
MGLFAVKIGWTRLAIFHIGSLQNNTIYTASGFFKRFRMAEKRKNYIQKKKNEAEALIKSFDGKNILGTTWREQNMIINVLTKLIENYKELEQKLQKDEELEQKLKKEQESNNEELQSKDSRTTPAKPPPIIGFKKQTITSAQNGTWQWTSLSRIREESRPDPRANGIISEDVWETIEKTIIVKEGFVRLKTIDNVSNVLDIVRQMKDLIRDARKGDYTLTKNDDEYAELMETARKKIKEEMDRQLTPRERVGNSVFSYRVSSLLLVPDVYSKTISDDMVLDVYPAILLRPDKQKKEILDIKKGFKISVVENTTTAPPSTTAPTTPVTPIQATTTAPPSTTAPTTPVTPKKAPAVPEAGQAANQAAMARIQQGQRERLLKEEEDERQQKLLKEEEDERQQKLLKERQQKLLKEKQDQEALQDAKDLQKSTEEEIARITKQNEKKRKKDQKLLKKKLEAERLLKENDDKAQQLKDQKPLEEKLEVEQLLKENEDKAQAALDLKAQQPKEEEAQEVQEEKEEEKEIEINKAKMKEAQEYPPAPSTKPEPLPAPPVKTPSTSPPRIDYNTKMSEEIYTVMRTSLEDKDFWTQITDGNEKDDEDVWDEKKKLIKQLYPLPELETWESETVDDLKANLTTLLNATEKLTYVESNKKKKQIPATYTFSYVGKNEVSQNLVLPQTNLTILPKQLEKGKSYQLQLKYTGETKGELTVKDIELDDSNESETKYYYPTDNLDFEETNFTTRTVKPIATPIPSGELSAMLAELSSMENTSDSEYVEEKWASDSEDFASDSEDFASDEF